MTFWSSKKITKTAKIHSSAKIIKKYKNLPKFLIIK